MDLKTAINALIDRRPADTRLATEPARGAIPGALGIGTRPPGSGDSTGSGIASPETSQVIEYYIAPWTSSDGLFSLPAPKRVLYTDAVGNAREEIRNHPQGTTPGEEPA